MKKLLVLSILMAALSGCSSLPPTYLKVGAGLKGNETNVYHEYTQVNDPLTARFELGMELSENVTIGYTHRSQWLKTNGEYVVDEVFIDYTFKFNWDR